MRRFFTSCQNIKQDKISIEDKSEIHHIKDVLRLTEGEEVNIFDDKGNEYRAQIESVSTENIMLRIKQKSASRGFSKIRIAVACAIPKKAKMDDIVDKLTQLGVDRIIPINTERVIIKLDKHKASLRHERWQKIAINASKQSQRNIVPVIDQVKEFKDILRESGNFDLKLIPALIGERKTLREVFKNCRPKSILILIGPEGDFTEAEVSSAKNRGFIPVSLGELVLRVDTAAIAVAAFLKFYENH